MSNAENKDHQIDSTVNKDEIDNQEQEKFEYVIPQFGQCGEDRSGNVEEMRVGDQHKKEIGLNSNTENTPNQVEGANGSNKAKGDFNLSAGTIQMKQNDSDTQSVKTNASSTMSKKQQTKARYIEKSLTEADRAL